MHRLPACQNQTVPECASGSKRSSEAPRRRILILNQLFWPDTAPTGLLAGDLARELGAWLLSFLLYRCIGGPKGFQWHCAVAYWCAGIGVAFALSDELHQALVPGRGSSLLDGVIDAFGVGIAILCIKLLALLWPPQPVRRMLRCRVSASQALTLFSFRHLPRRRTSLSLPWLDAARVLPAIWLFSQYKIFLGLECAFRGGGRAREQHQQSRD